MLLTPVLGEAATTSWPPWRRMGTAFEPIRPVPPITTIFISDLSVFARHADEWSSALLTQVSCGPPDLLSRPEEFQEVGVDLILMGGCYAVRRSGIVDFFCTLYELC